MFNNNPLNVCLDARLQDGLAGGVQQFIIGLASGLAKLTDGGEHFLFLSFPGADQWLRVHLEGPCKILYSSDPVPLRHRIEQIVRVIPSGAALLDKVLKLMGNPLLQLPASDGTIEGVNAAVMHFTHQSAFRTDVPSIYQPHDLQHLHFPEFFTARQRLSRDHKYREYCNQAQIVPVFSDWMKKEIINHFSLDPTKVKVIPQAPPVDAYSNPSENEIEKTRHKFSLTEPFLFYPAQTWPHKNHLGLVRALALLKKQNKIKPLLVCSGMTNDYFMKIKKELKKLQMTGQVRFLGYISPLEIQSVYRLCRIMVFPSKYEGWGLPVTEALRIGAPVACSRLGVLKEQAGEASLFFDPDNPQEVADTIYRLWIDADLRQLLSLKGQKTAARFSWEKTARIFRAHYRLLSGQPLKEEDQLLVQEYDE